MSKINRAIIVDGNSIIYKSFHAHRANEDLDSISVKQKTVETYKKLLQSLLLKNKFSHAVVVFDSGKPNFRSQKFSDYKAQRPKMPEDLIACIPYIIKATEETGAFKLVAPAPYEADDAIAAIAKQFLYSEIKTDIYTTDKDLLQLVDHFTSVNLLKTGASIIESHDHNNFQVKNLGILPYQIPFYKALVGDASDNYKGIPTIGEKKAQELINKYKNKKNLFKHLDDLPAKIKDTLIKHEKELDVFLDIATLAQDLHISYWISNFKFTQKISSDQLNTTN